MKLKALKFLFKKHRISVCAASAGIWLRFLHEVGFYIDVKLNIPKNYIWKIIFIGVMRVRRKIDKNFFENGWTDFNEKNICYGFQWYNIIEKLRKFFFQKIRVKNFFQSFFEFFFMRCLWATTTIFFLKKIFKYFRIICLSYKTIGRVVHT